MQAFAKQIKTLKDCIALVFLREKLWSGPNGKLKERQIVMQNPEIGFQQSCILSPHQLWWFHESSTTEEISCLLLFFTERKSQCRYLCRGFGESCESLNRQNTQQKTILSQQSTVPSHKARTIDACYSSWSCSPRYMASQLTSPQTTGLLCMGRSLERSVNNPITR